MNIHRVLFCGLVIFLPFSSRINADQNSFFTSNLPESDRAEIMSVAPGASDGPKVNLDSRQLSKLNVLLRALTRTEYGAPCDKVQYVFRFYEKNEVIAIEGICFNCGCFATLDSKLHPDDHPLGFDTTTAKAKELETFLEKLFPGDKSGVSSRTDPATRVCDKLAMTD
jgi:hypothetical protein